MIVSIESYQDGIFEIAVPRNLIDPRMDGGGGPDDEFIVLVDGEETNSREPTKSPCFRKLLIHFPPDAEQIELIGTSIGLSPGWTTIPPVFVISDKNNNVRGEIKVSGCTDLALDEKEVILEVINREGEPYQTISVTPNRDGSFSTSLFVEDADGTYTVKATYADYTYTYVPEFPVSLIILGVSFAGLLVAARLFSSTNKHNVY